MPREMAPRMKNGELGIIGTKRKITPRTIIEMPKIFLNTEFINDLLYQNNLL